MTIDEERRDDKLRLVLRLPHYAHFVVCLHGTDRKFSCSFVLQHPFPIAFGGTPDAAETRLGAVIGALQSLEQTVHSERAQAFVAPPILHAIDCILCDTGLVDHLVGVWQAADSGNDAVSLAAASKMCQEGRVRAASDAEYQIQDEPLDATRFQRALVLDAAGVARITEFGRRLAPATHVCVQ